MTSFRELLDARVAQLRAHPRVRVTNYWVGPPASESELSEVEAKVGPLPPSIRAFYSQSNGLQLRWIDTENPEYTDRDEAPMVSSYVWRAIADAAGADGRVDIGPVATLLEPEDLYDDGDEVLAFDTLDDIGMVAFARGAAVTTRLRIGSDHNVCWDELPFDFDAYLALIVATFGHAERRKKACFDKGPREPVALEELVSRVVVTAQRLARDLPRVEFEDERYHRVRLRGTTLSVNARGDDAASILHVRTDLGGDVYVPRRNAVAIEANMDAYELARNNPEGYLSALVQVSSAASRGMFASLWGKRGSGRMKHPELPSFAPEVFRVLGLFAPLDPERVATDLAKVYATWLAEVGPATDVQSFDSLHDLADTLTVILGRPMPSRPQGLLLRQLADLASSVEALVASRRGEPRLLAEHASYWRKVAAGTAARLVAVAEPWHTLGTSIGLEPIALLG